MRNALGLMLASVVAAVVIAGVWFWTSSPRADAAAPQTIAARKTEPMPPTATTIQVVGCRRIREFRKSSKSDIGVDRVEN